MFGKLMTVLRTMFEAAFGIFMRKNAGNVAKAGLRKRSESLKDARQNAGANQGLISNLEGEIRAAEQEESEWLASARAAKAAGDNAEMNKAVGRVGRIRGNLEDMNARLTEAQTTQDGYLDMLSNAGDDLEDDRRDIRSLNIQREMANSEASLQTGFGDDSDFDEAKRNLQSETNRARGQVAVNTALKSGPKYGSANNSSILDEL